MPNQPKTSERPVALNDITAAVIASFDGCDDPRLREVLIGLVRHLHAFATEVRLTECEWAGAIRYLTDVGHITDEWRQEFILLSDTLGLSMLVDAMAHERPSGGTESTVLGPFWAAGSPLRDYGESIAEEPSGTPALVYGCIRDTNGVPVTGAELDVWQNGENRLYAVQDQRAPEFHLRGRFIAREDGSYAFLGLRPLDYPIQDDGPVGRMLKATGRHPWRPAHIHMVVRAPGHQTLTTQIFDSESPYLDSDAVFGVKPSLVHEFVRRSPDDPDRPDGVAGEWFSVENDVILVPEAGCTPTA